jgi:D-methionine transport system substrate-binding protein
MKNVTYRKLVSVAASVVSAAMLLTGCGKPAGSDANAATPAVTETAAEATADETTDAATDATEATEETGEGDVVVLKGIVDLVPHSEIIEYVIPKLEEQGIKIELVSTAADSTTNEKLNAGEIDFNYFQHDPYLQS